jgi:hypothetical protein
MKIPVRHILISILLYTAGICAQISIIGFPPGGISAATMNYEYRRLFTILAPGRQTDMAPLTIEYFFRQKLLAQGDTLPEWGGGGAIGGHAIIIPLDAAPFLQQNFYQITLHELTHSIINRLCPGQAVPRWFHEGVAMICSGEVTFQEQVIISQAILFQRLMPLAAIDSVNSFGKMRAELAYCQSRQALLTLIDTWGMDAVREVLHQTRQQNDFWQAVDTVMAITPQEFEQHTRSDIAKRFNAISFLSDSYLWIGIVFLFLTGVVVTRIRNIRKARLLDEADSLDAKSGGAGLEPARTESDPVEYADTTHVYEDEYSSDDGDDEDGDDELNDERSMRR